MAKEAASLNPEDFVEGGGLIDDVDVVLKELSFEMFDYQGSAPETPSLKVLMDVDGDEMDQYYSMGSPKDWMPSDDGKQLIAVGTASGIRMSSNGGIFLKSLIDAGFPTERLGTDISVVNGTEAHVIRVPAPKRSGIKQTAKQKEREEKYGPATILVVGEILTLPGESKAKGKAKGKAKPAAGKGKPKPKTSGDVEEKTTEALVSILAEVGTLTKKEIPGHLFKTLKDDPDRNEAIKIAFDDEFLGNGPWEYDDGTLIAG